MLMDIDPLPMRGSLVMTMVRISPSRRDVSPAEQLRRSPRLVPPRLRLVAAVFLSERLLMNFFEEKASYSRRWSLEGCQGPTRQGRAPTLMDSGWPPSGISFTQYFLLIPKMTFVEFQDFWSCAEYRSLIFSPFPAQNSSCRHSPSSCKPCKIRENRQKYCDITCNNSP